MFLSYEALASVYAPLIRNPPPPYTLPTAVEEPEDRLPPALQRASLWADRLWLSRIDMSHSWITAESWREEFIALRNLRLGTPHPLGDLPLIVLRRGRRSSDTLNRRQADLALLSSRGRLIVATTSDHEIQLYQPDLVADAVREVVEATRRQPVPRR